jgi:hypothetical protein
VPEPVRTKAIWIEERETGVVILQTTPRGTAPGQVSSASCFNSESEPNARIPASSSDVTREDCAIRTVP